MGVVYEGVDPVIGRHVAIKTCVPPPGIAPDAVAAHRGRFLREARAVGQLNHPSIVAIYDAGWDEPTEVSFMAMELVRGSSLEQRLSAGGRFTVAEAVAIAIEIGAALDEAHGRGIVHRDVKPANVVLGDDGSVKLTDFGIARFDELELTRTGQVVGTPNYMSPEQLRGGRVTARSDLFALGIVLYRLWTGERPFRGDNATAVSYQIVHEDPLPPTAVRPELPRQCDEIVARLLAKDADRRYASATELCAALRTLDGDAPSPAAVHASDHDARSRERGTVTIDMAPLLDGGARESWLPGVLGAAIVVGVLWVAAWLVSGGAPPPRPIPLEPAVQAQAQAPPPTPRALGNVVDLAPPRALLPPVTRAVSPEKPKSPPQPAGRGATLLFENGYPEGRLEVLDGGAAVLVEAALSLAEGLDKRQVIAPFEIPEGCGEVRVRLTVPDKELAIEEAIDVPAAGGEPLALVVKRRVFPRAHLSLEWR